MSLATLWFMLQTNGASKATPKRRPATSAFVKAFEKIGITDVESAGGKGANLGELTAAGFPVPPGFVVTAPAYLEAIDAAGLRSKLLERVVAVDVDDSEALRRVCEENMQAVRSVAVPQAIRKAVRAALKSLGEDRRVAVRSSATGEDSEDASFAGMNATFTNVCGYRELLERIVDCWASLWSPRVVSYRGCRHILEEPAIAVVVQVMVDSERAGVMFTVDPASGDRQRMVVEAAVGLGEVVVSGQVELDTYVLDKTNQHPLQVRIGRQTHTIAVGKDGHDERTELGAEAQGARVLSDAQLVELGRLGSAVEAHYGRPQDIEWAFVGAVLWLLQTRPVTTLNDDTRSGELLTGLGASPGVAVGRVRVLSSPRDGDALERGEILVATMTSPDWVPTLRRAGALVTDGGGMTCHAAIVSRELGIPCVVGTRTATTVLRDGELVTVDGADGSVVAGDTIVSTRDLVATAPNATAAAAAGVTPPLAPLATKIYVNLAIAESAERVAALPVDGVGLLRAEFMITDALDGVHPKALLAEGGREHYLAAMTASLERIARAFAPRPVIYRTYDFRSNEFSGLRGAGDYEPNEENPMIGYRGCFRYIRDPELFELDLETLARVRERYPNVHVMIPFVRTVWELEVCLELIARHRLGRQRGLEKWIMAEVPSVVYRIPDYARMGIDGVSIGSNDLTQLMLGVDRDSEICAELFDETDAAVLDAIGRIIGAAREAGIAEQSSLANLRGSRER